MAAGRLDAIVIPSSSAAEALVASGLVVAPHVRVFAIGPSTAATAEQLGLPAARVQTGSGVDSMVAELVAGLGPAAADRTDPFFASASSD